MRDYHEILDQIKIRRYHEYGYGDHDKWMEIVGGEQSLYGMEIVSYGVRDLKSDPEQNRIMAASNHLMICLYSIIRALLQQRSWVRATLGPMRPRSSTTLATWALRWIA